MKIIDGKIIAQKILIRLQSKVKTIKNEYNKIPHIAIILVGNKPDSYIYTSLKIKRAKEIGIKATLYKLNENIKEEELIKLINKLNKSKSVNAILVQLPLIKHINTDTIIQHIDPIKDVDGFHKYNTSSSKPYIISPVYQAVFESIQYTKIPLKDKKITIISKSDVFCVPMKKIFEQKKSNPICIKPTAQNLIKYTKTADIIITAIGNPKFISSDMIKQGCILIDIGITKKKNKIYGDIDISSVSKKASYITPVPGGIGPLTIAFALKNTLKLFFLQNEITHNRRS